MSEVASYQANATASPGQLGTAQQAPRMLVKQRFDAQAPSLTVTVPLAAALPAQPTALFETVDSMEVAFPLVSDPVGFEWLLRCGVPTPSEMIRRRGTAYIR